MAVKAACFLVVPVPNWLISNVCILYQEEYMSQVFVAVIWWVRRRNFEKSQLALVHLGLDVDNFTALLSHF